jgi:hypothetical protein
LSKAYDFTTQLVSAQFVRMEAMKAFFEIFVALENANKFFFMLLTMAF